MRILPGSLLCPTGEQFCVLCASVKIHSLNTLVLVLFYEDFGFGFLIDLFFFFFICFRFYYSFFIVDDEFMFVDFGCFNFVLQK